jgi:hypothetical protein
VFETELKKASIDLTRIRRLFQEFEIETEGKQKLLFSWRKGISFVILIEAARKNGRQGRTQVFCSQDDF